jgi:BirA family biotin operon repressor/biotin-[acetyl-CoA-carboxylase] ligase
MSVVPSTARSGESYDGRSAADLAAALELPRVVLFDEVGSTLDVTHELAEAGADAGTLVLADAQTAGRGRMGRSWRSEPGAGIWLTLLERPGSDESLGVLALRIALALAPALDPFAPAPIRLKWPNDLFIEDKKLAGVLVEARWHGAHLDWLALGVGINLRVPEVFKVAALLPAVDRVGVLEAVVPALRLAVRKSGRLTERELVEFQARDLALGKRVCAPAVGIVAGLGADGALLVDGPDGRIACHAGSLVLDRPLSVDTVT